MTGPSTAKLNTNPETHPDPDIDNDPGVDPDPDPNPNPNPEQWYRAEGHLGRVGFITSMSKHFCGGCNRLR